MEQKRKNVQTFLPNSAKSESLSGTETQECANILAKFHEGRKPEWRTNVRMRSILTKFREERKPERNFRTLKIKQREGKETKHTQPVNFKIPLRGGTSWWKANENTLSVMSERSSEKG